MNTRVNVKLILCGPLDELSWSNLYLVSHFCCVFKTQYGLQFFLRSCQGLVMGSPIRVCDSSELRCSILLSQNQILDGCQGRCYVLAPNWKSLRLTHEAFMKPNPEIIRPLNLVESQVLKLTRHGSLWVIHAVEVSLYFHF
jgi:hypothetical protein